MIVFASENLLESSDGLVDGDELAGVVGEHFSNLEKKFREGRARFGGLIYLERLRQESFDLSCSGDLEFVFL